MNSPRLTGLTEHGLLALNKKKSKLNGSFFPHLGQVERDEPDELGLQRTPHPVLGAHQSDHAAGRLRLQGGLVREEVRRGARVSVHNLII